MTGTPQGHSRWAKAGIALAVTTAVSILLVLQEYALVHPRFRDEWSWKRALLVEAVFWNVWLPALPLLARLVRRFPLDAKRWARNLPVYIVAAPVAATFHLALHLAIANPLLLPPRTYRERFFLNWGGGATTSEVLTFTLLVAGFHAHAYAKRYQEEALRASELESQLVRSQLEALKMQLQPHFLFNTLHAVSELMYQDVEAADRMIARLSGLLRASLQSAPRQSVPLREELEFLRGYLDIEQARLGDRLTVTTTIEPETLEAAVPNLILQPLVENAVRHGIAPYRRQGRISIDARRTGAGLEIVIQDDGPGLARKPFEEGIGLGNVRARLTRLYGPAHRFELRDGATCGLTVTLAFPFQIHEG